MSKKFGGYFLFRCCGSCTFPAVEAFVASGKKQEIIWITPSKSAKAKLSVKERKKLKAVKMRAIRLESPDGTISVLLTNLLGKISFSADEIIDLYFRRWEVEVYYRDEKVTLEVEKFHSHNPNGIRQELFSSMIMSVISRTIMALSSEHLNQNNQECQFKNTIITLASEAAILVPENPEQAVTIFYEILDEITRVKYYRPKTSRPSQPRINKSPLNKWSKTKRIKDP